MQELFLQLLRFAYGAVGLITFIAYFPTIKDLYVYKKPSANISSYILWTTTSGIALLYGLFILSDMLFISVSAVSFFACAIVLVLSIRLKRNK